MHLVDDADFLNLLRFPFHALHHVVEKGSVHLVEQLAFHLGEVFEFGGGFINSV